MEYPLQILCDELASQGKSWDEIQRLAGSLENPLDQLDLAEWLANNRGVSDREIIAEKHRLMRNRMKK